MLGPMQSTWERAEVHIPASKAGVQGEYLLLQGVLADDNDTEQAT